ncbi:MAG TPA: Ger(x)C family spore germination protein, partial [Candidatus Deferrimicrobium sp.]|nr:Ger(x)C family spore germination protein [Candidatus Deferrimicrobium sp.]
MFRKSLFAAIIILLLFCMGCWNRREPEAYSYLTFLAIDKADNGQIKLGFLYTPPLSPVPTGIKPPESLSLVSTIEARSLFEGIRNSTSHLPARSFFGYVHAIIFSEELAREGLSKYLDLIYRDHEIRKNAFVFITKGSSTPLVQMDSKVPEPPGRILEGLIASEERSQGKSRVVRLKDLQTELSGPGFDPVISVLQLWDEDGNKLVGSGEKIPKKTSVALNGSAVFKGDKLIGWMSSEESQTYLIGKGEMRGGLLVIPHPNSEEGNVSIEFGKGKQKLTAKLNNKQVVVNLKVSINGSVG